MAKFNPALARLRNYLLNTFQKNDVSVFNNSLSAPCLLLKLSKDEQTLEITNFDAATGKHYSASYFTPVSLDAFEKRLEFNRSKLTNLLTTITKTP